jgi:hypothetical protein
MPDEIEIIPEIPAENVLPAAEPVEPPPVAALGSVSAAAQALRERLVSHGIELPDEVQWAEVPGPLLDALLEALPAQPGPRPTEEELRHDLADRIARSQRLPRGVRERLADSLASVRFDDTGREEPALRVSDAVALLEETLPAHVLLAPDEVDAATHPRLHDQSA